MYRWLGISILDLGMIYFVEQGEQEMGFGKGFGLIQDLVSDFILFVEQKNRNGLRCAGMGSKRKRGHTRID